jgi:hypothetical protein
VIDNHFRSILPRFTSPLICLYSALGLTPNGVTWVGAALAGVAACCVIVDWRVAAGIDWWLGRLADGIFARATDQCAAGGRSPSRA